jgi:hypothetical protein
VRCVGSSGVVIESVASTGRWLDLGVPEMVRSAGSASTSAGGAHRKQRAVGTLSVARERRSTPVISVESVDRRRLPGQSHLACHAQDRHRSRPSEPGLETTTRRGTMTTWEDAPDAFRRAIEALEVVPADEQVAALRGLVEDDGTDLAEEVARVLVARRVGRQWVDQMSEPQVLEKARTVMEAAIGAGQLNEESMAEVLSAGDLRAKVAEFVANGYIRSSPVPNPALQRMLRGEADPSILDDEVARYLRDQAA